MTRTEMHIKLNLLLLLLLFLKAFFNLKSFGEFIFFYAVPYFLYACFMGTLLPPLTPVFVSCSMWRPVPRKTLLFARMIWGGRTWAGRRHRAGQVGIHVVWVCAAHWTAAGWCWWHRWHTAHTQRSAARDDRWVIHNRTCARSHTEWQLWYLDFLEGFPNRDSTEIREESTDVM